MAEHPVPPQTPKHELERGPQRGRWRWAALGLLGLAAVGLGLWRRRPAQEPVPAPASPPLLSPPPEPEEIRHPDGRIEHPKVRREPRDARFGLVLGFLIGMACVLTILLYSVWHLYWSQAGAQAQLKTSPSPLITAPSTRLPAEPILDELERFARIESGNVYKRLAAKEKILNEYGQTEEKGFAHIPIQDAIEQTVDHLPVRKQSPPSSSDDKGLVDSGEPNSGRVLRGGQR